MRDLALGIITCLLFVGLVILFCIVLVKLYIRKIKNYTQQLYQKDIDFQKTLTTAVIETQELVLNNISRDLHDDAGQQLTVINFQLEHLKLDSPEYNDALAPLSESLGKLSQSIRSISHALSDQLVVQQDLIKAIASEMKRLQNNTRVDISFSPPGITEKQFTVNEKIIIYRIFQECLNNIFKHSKATGIVVAITVSPRFKMTVTDNGIGFDTIRKAGKASLGLLNMNSRAESINYQLSIESQPGKGTAITLTENPIT